MSKVEITHPDKVLFPDGKISKQDLVNYYQTVADIFIPEILDRPVVLVRSPGGLNRGQFYQRHPSEDFPDYIERITVRGKAEVEVYIHLDSLEDVLYLVNLGVVEFHTWNATIHDLDHPDRIVFDLDPAPDAPWESVLECAREIKAILAKHDLSAQVKTSGKKGLHIIVPIKPEHPWAVVKNFCLEVATEAAKKQPAKFTTNLPKAKRKGKVFIDYLRNDKSASCVAAYSTRAFKNATVSMPVAWEKLGSKLSPDQFHIGNAAKEITKVDWVKFIQKKQSLVL